MSLTRRTFLLSFCLLPYLPKVGLAQPTDWASLAKEDLTPPEIPPELAEFRDKPSLNNDSLDGHLEYGTYPAYDIEITRGNKILANSPVNCKPIDVALYFLSIGQGDFGKENIPYVTAWPVRSNPVIKGFFEFTKQKPQGDTTAWCAAFMNFCLIKSSINRTLPANSSEPTRSAASKSFRTWGKETTSPKPGDIVVFVNKVDSSHGHVGFFLAEQGEKILVLGGNQFEGKPVRHTINRKLIPKNGSVLKLHSYRTEDQLHV
ncbi:TPA: CHAP domain-containing protein [Klebsiella variicola subsp. variicola]|nr:CHAP domain-containing protein [Klebsiella variicola subsp. variicola]